MSKGHLPFQCILYAGAVLCSSDFSIQLGWDFLQVYIFLISDSAGSDRPEILSNKFSILSPARTRPTSCHRVSLESSCTGTQAFSSDALVIVSPPHSASSLSVVLIVKCEAHNKKPIIKHNLCLA